MSFKEDTYKITNELAELLIAKNKKYGNSALEPVRVFSKASASEQLLVRLDDKLSRLRTQTIDEDEDVLQDLLGYLVLFKMSKQIPATSNKPAEKSPCSDLTKDDLLVKTYKLFPTWRNILKHHRMGYLMEKLEPFSKTTFTSEFSQTNYDGDITIQGTNITIPLTLVEEVR